jgi:hypothetical protein
VSSNHERLLAAQDLKVSLAILSLFSLVKALKIHLSQKLEQEGIFCAADLCLRSSLIGYMLAI